MEIGTSGVDPNVTGYDMPLTLEVRDIHSSLPMGWVHVRYPLLSFLFSRVDSPVEPTKIGLNRGRDGRQEPFQARYKELLDDRAYLNQVRWGVLR